MEYFEKATKKELLKHQKAELLADGWTEEEIENMCSAKERLEKQEELVRKANCLDMVVEYINNEIDKLTAENEQKINFDQRVMNLIKLECYNNVLKVVNQEE